MQTGIHIGHNKESAKEIQKAVLEILNSRADQETIRAALGVISNAFKIEGVAINNCSVSGGK